MENILENDELYQSTAPTVEGLGFSVVGLKSRRVGKTFQVQLVVHAPDGVSVEDCATIYRTVLPRMEIELGTPDIHLEVSSPGLSRTIKSTHEFAIFEGNPAEILVQGSEEWMKGTIKEAGGSTVSLNSGGRIIEISYSDIRKARLDYP